MESNVAVGSLQASAVSLNGSLGSNWKVKNGGSREPQWTPLSSE